MFFSVVSLLFSISTLSFSIVADINEYFFCKIKYQMPFSKYLKVGILYRPNGVAYFVKCIRGRSCIREASSDCRCICDK